jgi:hypothetical protein
MLSVGNAVGQKWCRSEMESVKNAVGQNCRRSKMLFVKNVGYGSLYRKIISPKKIDRNAI